MNNTEDVIALTANGGKLVDGKPDYYVDDEVFSRILNDTEFAQRVFKSIGSEEVCIARLGINIIPIEVKSSDNIRSRSLNEYVNKYSPEYSIRISSKNFGFENNIKSIPLYAVFCIK